MNLAMKASSNSASLVLLLLLSGSCCFDGVASSFAYLPPIYSNTITITGSSSSSTTIGRQLRQRHVNSHRNIRTTRTTAGTAAATTKARTTHPTPTPTTTQRFLIFGDNNNDDHKNSKNNDRKQEGISNMQYKLEKLSQKQVPDKQVEELLRNYGERSRTYRRDVFTSADWIRTRRPDRFVDNLLTIFSSGLIRQVSFELAVLATVSAFVVIYNDVFVEGFVDLSGQHKYGPFLGGLPALQLPMLPFTLSTAALGLLLTFRTNVSYARWNEARTAWGKVINDSRSVVRMGCIWARSYNNIDDVALQRLGEATCSFGRALMNRLLSPQEDGERFRQYTFTALTDQHYAQVLRDSKHRPTAALAEITQILVDFQLNPIHQVEVERVVTGLCDALGASERIFTSPVPTFYTRHTARFLAIWLFALPLGLYAPFGSTWNHFAMIPATVALGLFFLGIERLATEMEEPFSILPMEKMCEGSIRTPVMEQVERSMMGDYRPVTIIEASTVSPPLYPPPVKVTTIEVPPASDPQYAPQSTWKSTSAGPPPVMQQSQQPQWQTPPPQQEQQQPQWQTPRQQPMSIPETMPQPLPSRPAVPVPAVARSFSPPPGLSEADKAKLSQYFGDAPLPPQLPTESLSLADNGINGDYYSNPNTVSGGDSRGGGDGDGDGEQLSVEEMNRLWASHSQSENSSQSTSSSSSSNRSYMDSLGGGMAPPKAKASSSSYLPNGATHKRTSGTGMPSYFDSFN